MGRLGRVIAVLVLAVPVVMGSTGCVSGRGSGTETTAVAETTPPTQRGSPNPGPVGYRIARGAVVEATGEGFTQRASMRVGDLIEIPEGWHWDPARQTRLAYAERRDRTRIYQAIAPGTVRAIGPLPRPTPCKDGCPNAEAPNAITITVRE